MTYKTLIIMLFVFLFSSCQQNDLGIVYEPKAKQEKVEGKWVGKIICPDCCNIFDKEYGFDLNITDFDKDEFTFNTTLTITAYENGKPTEYYAIYKDCKGQLKNGIMKIEGGEIKMKNEKVCSFCKDNKYELRKVSKNKYKGKWTYSGYCGSISKTAEIIIEKK